MNNKKIILTIIISMATISLVALFWKNSLLMVLILIILSLFKHSIFPLKREFLLFVLGGIFGTLGESIVIVSGAWTYAQPHLFNFPVWLPFLWGLAGITGLSFYEGLMGDKS